METKKIMFNGFARRDGQLGTEANLIVNLLKKHYNVEISDAPDYVFCNVANKEHLKYDGIKIFCTIEAICPDFNLFDYGIGFEYLTYGDRYLRFPNYCFSPRTVDGMAAKHLEIDNGLVERSFCSFVYSNGEADSMRIKLFRRLSKYKQVDAGGRLLNNLQGHLGVKDKIEFEHGHKFSIACENASHPGYHTEKLAEAFAAKTVPVYWGDPEVDKVFNPEAFINCMEFSSIDEVVERVIFLDTHPEEYLRMLREPALREQAEGVQSEYEISRLEDFLLHIFEPPLEQAYRRNRGFWGRNYLQEKRSEARVIERYFKLRSWGIIGYLAGRKSARIRKKHEEETMRDAE